MWRKGAHEVYLATPPESIWLCPDCSWQWVQQLVSVGWRRPLGDVGGASGLMALLSSSCQPGAGAEAAADRPVDARRVRRWVLRYLRRAGGWVECSSMLSAVLAHVAQTARASETERALRAILCNLERCGSLQLDEATGRRYMRLVAE